MNLGSIFTIGTAATLLQIGVAVADPLPTTIGQCTNTTIKEVTSRLEDSTTHQWIPGSGSAVDFANGGYQVLRHGRRDYQVAPWRSGENVPRLDPAGLPAGRQSRPHVQDDEPAHAWRLDTAGRRAQVRRRLAGMWCSRPPPHTLPQTPTAIIKPLQ
jgi:hypothetical protein